MSLNSGVTHVLGLVQGTPRFADVTLQARSGFLRRSTANSAPESPLVGSYGVSNPHGHANPAACVQAYDFRHNNNRYPVTPEEKARQEIGRQLAACGWIVHSYAVIKLTVRRGSFPLPASHSKTGDWA